MSIEYWFLFVCIGTLALITIGLIFNTMITGSKYFKTFQLLMSAMPYSAEAEKTISLILDKFDANLLVAKISDCNTNMVFYSTVDESGAKYDKSTSPIVAEIFIGSKYYAYGYVRKYYSEAKAELTKKRPSVKTLKRIIALENKLRGEINTNEPPSVIKSKNNIVVELE